MKSIPLSKIGGLLHKMNVDVKSRIRLFANDTAAYLAISKPAESKQLQANLNIQTGSSNRTWNLINQNVR